MLSKFIFYFIHEEGSVTGTLASITLRWWTITEEGMEIPIIIDFVQNNKLILENMDTFVGKQLK